MRPRLINAHDDKSNTVWTLAVVLGVGLGAVADGGDGALDGERAAVCQARGERLRLEEVGEDAGVGGEASETQTEVRVDRDDLLLVGGELFCVALGMVSEVVRGIWGVI